jgi:hypothetical protein
MSTRQWNEMRRSFSTTTLVLLLVLGICRVSAADANTVRGAASNLSDYNLFSHSVKGGTSKGSKGPTISKTKEKSQKKAGKAKGGQKLGSKKGHSKKGGGGKGKGGTKGDSVKGTGKPTVAPAVPAPTRAPTPTAAPEPTSKYSHKKWRSTSIYGY